MQQVRFPDSTEVDCISDSHAIEVEFSDVWYPALSQSIHYSYWTREIAADLKGYEKWNERVSKRWGKKVEWSRKAGIILVCREEDNEKCIDYLARLHRIIEEYSLPVTVWDCEEADLSLDACELLDGRTLVARLGAGIVEALMVAELMPLNPALIMLSRIIRSVLRAAW
jgi:hypothetical protein